MRLYTCFDLGFSVQQNVENLPVGTTNPLPCISNWIILMQQLKGSVNFTRNWTEYKNGFGNFSGSDFWIGNEKIYVITNRSGIEYMLRVEVCRFFHSIISPRNSIFQEILVTYSYLWAN